MYFHPLSKL